MWFRLDGLRLPMNLFSVSEELGRNQGSVAMVSMDMQRSVEGEVCGHSSSPSSVDTSPDLQSCSLMLFSDVILFFVRSLSRSISVPVSECRDWLSGLLSGRAYPFTTSSDMSVFLSVGLALWWRRDCRRNESPLGLIKALSESNSKCLPGSCAEFSLCSWCPEDTTLKKSAQEIQVLYESAVFLCLFVQYHSKGFYFLESLLRPIQPKNHNYKRQHYLASTSIDDIVLFITSARCS